MKIDKKTLICGISIIIIRNFLRQFRTPASFSLQNVSGYFAVSKQVGNSLLKALIALEYVEKKSVDKYEVTVKGNALAQTKFVNRMNKAKVDRIFSEFMKRVERVNEDDTFIYRISKLILFGSYLNPAAVDYGDIDIAYELERKIIDNDKFQEINQCIIDDAKRNGKYFSSMVDELFYTYDQVLYYLKNRSPYISLHRIEDIEILSAPHKQIYP